MQRDFLIRRYTSGDFSNWEKFLSETKNSHFMHSRKYLHYHGDRFLDYSLIIEDADNKIMGILPAAIVRDQLISHPGLSFGGLLIKENIKFSDYLNMFYSLVEFIEENLEVDYFLLKLTPEIYHSQFSNEVMYCGFHTGFELTNVELSTVVDYSRTINLQGRRRRAIRKAQKHCIQVALSEKIIEFWDFLSFNLQERHSVKPVHTVSEIKTLINTFPQNIKLFTAELSGEILAGVIIFETKQVAHAQYISVGDKGRDSGALDLLLKTLLDEYSSLKKFFSFGVSTEQAGAKINFGLLAQKEGFGGVAFPHIQLVKRINRE